MPFRARDQRKFENHVIGKFFNHIDAGVAPLLKHSSSVVTLSDAGAHLIYMCDAAFGLHFLGHWVRKTGEFSLEEGIRRITSHAADRFKIPNRGRLIKARPLTCCCSILKKSV